jgi:predicted enzyme related to lactoylglutathione lyase
MVPEMAESPLTNAFATTVLPAVDANRAYAFYHDTLGMDVEWLPDTAGYFFVNAGKGSQILVFQREATKAEHTAVSFAVDDIVSAVAALKARGVVFEEYDYPGLKTVDSVATMGATRSAWFKDSEGNIIGLNQMM